MKKLLAACVFFGLLTCLVAACGSGSTSTENGNSSTTGNGGRKTAVHLGDMSFMQSSITISKGGSIILVEDSAVPHIIANGSWVNGNPQPMQENGAPVVNNVQISGSSQTIGPFNTPGTFHLYCPVHPGMNLTVIVQ